MTIETEIAQIGNTFIHNKAARLWLPEWIMPDFANAEIPDEADLWAESATQKYPIGAQLSMNDCLYRYARSGEAMSAVSFLKCLYTQCPGKAGNSVGAGFEGAAYKAVAAGGTAIKIADTAATKNLYEGALLVIYNDTDKCYDQYIVIGNDASNGTYTILYIAPPGLKNALTTSYGITVYLNPYMDIRAFSTGGGYASAAGFAKFDISAAGKFFWLLTAGRVSGIAGASTWPGQTQYRRDVYANTDGSVIGGDSTTIYYQRIGYLLARTASDYGDNQIMLQLDEAK